MTYAQMMLAVLFAVGCGGHDEGHCVTEMFARSTTFALDDDADGGTADFAGASCSSVCQAHAPSIGITDTSTDAGVTGCNFVTLPTGPGVSCDYSQIATLCP